MNEKYYNCDNCDDCGSIKVKYKFLNELEHDYESINHNILDYANHLYNNNDIQTKEKQQPKKIVLPEVNF